MAGPRALGLLAAAWAATALAAEPTDHKVVTDKTGIRHTFTVAPYRVVSGYEGHDGGGDYLKVQEAATGRTLLDVMPGQFPEAAQRAQAHWAIEGTLCVYGALKAGRGAVHGYDLSRGREAYRLDTGDLGPGDLGEMRIVGGRLYLNGHQECRTLWIQLRRWEDGRAVWKLDGKDLPGWAIRAERAGDALVLSGLKADGGAWVQARDFGTGRRLWDLARPSWQVAPSLHVAGGRVLVVSAEAGVGTRIESVEAAGGRVCWSTAIKPFLPEAAVENGTLVLRGLQRTVHLELAGGQVVSDMVSEPAGPDGKPRERPAGTIIGGFTAAEKREMDALIGKWESQPDVQAMGWTMTHCATEKGQERAKGVFNAIQAYTQDDVAGFRAGGGAAGILRGFETMLADPDPVLRAFAAVVLAGAGRQESKGKIAALLKASPDRPAVEPASAEGIDRSRAAVALGMLGASEYAGEMAAMLAAPQPQVRAGAALGLGHLKARPHAAAVAGLLKDDNDNVKGSAMRSLTLMGAREHAGAIAGTLAAGGDPSLIESACDALARLGAVEEVPRIAPLLAKDHYRGLAARTLAALGQRQHAPAIAALLDSPDALERRDACLSLALLDARDRRAAIARRLKDPEAFVAADAATALALLNASDFTPQLLPLYNPARGDLRRYPLPPDRIAALLAQADRNVQAMKASASRPTTP